jgi:hypothetical protein
LSPSPPEDLDLEARRFAAYLIDRELPPALIERYRRANDQLLPDPPAAQDRALMALVRAHPALLPLLDGASGLIRPTCLLRKKLLIMLALLETTPEFADWFEPPARGGVRTIVALIGQGTLAALQVAGGLLIWPLVLVRGRISRAR